MAQDLMGEAVNAFKRSLAEVSDNLNKAISNIEKTSVEQIKKQVGTQQSSSSSAKEKEVQKSANMHIRDQIQARTLAEKHAHRFYDIDGFKGLEHNEVVDKLVAIMLKSGESIDRKEIAIGTGKEQQSLEKSDRDYKNLESGTRRKLIRLRGKEEAERIMSEYSKMDTDAYGNLQFQYDFTSIMNETDELSYEDKKKKEEEIKAEKEERRRDKEERRRDKEERKQKELLKELRAEFNYTEKEIQNEERQQVLALKERQQLQLGVGNDLIQGGAGMAMGVALNKPTIIFASLATSAAKVTSRFGMLGKAIAGVIAVLSAVGAVVNVLSGKTSDNVLKGSVKDIRPEYSGALKAVGASFLGDENALLEDVGNITNLKANISNEVGFSQTLSSMISSPVGAMLAKKGINLVNILQKVNGMTTEDAHDYLMGVMESLDNSNSRRLFAKSFGLENSLNLQHQRMLNGSGETGRDIIRQAKQRIGEIPNEAKHAIDKSQKKEAIARAALENNPEFTKFMADVKGYGADTIDWLNGDNNKKDKMARAEYDAGRLLGRSLPHLINEGKTPEKIDYNHMKSLKIGGFTKADRKAREAHKAFLERDRTFNRLSGKDLEKAQTENLQQFFNELQTIQMNSKNANSTRNNGVNITSNVTLTNKSSVPLKISDTNTNAVIVQPEGAK